MKSQPYQVIGLILQDIRTVEMVSDWSIANAGKVVIGIGKVFEIILQGSTLAVVS